MQLQILCASCTCLIKNIPFEVISVKKPAKNWLKSKDCVETLGRELINLVYVKVNTIFV